MADDDGAGPSTSYGGGGGGRGGRGRGRGGGSSSAGGRSSGGDDDGRGPPSPRRYRGITWDKISQKWRDQTSIKENGKQKKIKAGLHDTQEVAARAHAW